MLLSRLDERVFITERRRRMVKSEGREDEEGGGEGEKSLSASARGGLYSWQSASR